MQTVETMIWIYTVCQRPFYETPGISGLKSVNEIQLTQFFKTLSIKLKRFYAQKNYKLPWHHRRYMKV